MCENDISDVKRAVSRVVATKAQEGGVDREEAMEGLVATVAEKLARGSGLDEIETLLGGGAE